MSIRKKIGRFFCRHDWEKFMGLRNIGRGKFAQKYSCRKCGKMKEVIR